MDIKDTQDFITLCKRNWKHALVLLLIGLAIVFAKGYCERKGQKIADGPSEIHTEDSPLNIPQNEIERNVKAIQSQAKGFATLSSDQKIKVSKLIYHLAQNMSIRDSAFVNERSVDFINHVISKSSEGIPWDEVNLLSEIFVELDEPSLRILSAYTTLQTDAITIWRNPEPRAYPGEVSIDDRDKMKVYYELRCGWIAIDEATRNFNKNRIAVPKWHYSEEGRGNVQLVEKGKALVEYINGSVLIHPQLIK